MKEMARMGSGISAPGATGLISGYVDSDDQSREESGAIDEMLLKAAEFYEAEVEDSLTRLTTLLEPAAIILLGGIVAFVVLSIAMPMFEMMNIVGS